MITHFTARQGIALTSMFILGALTAVTLTVISAPAVTFVTLVIAEIVAVLLIVSSEWSRRG